MFDIDKIFIASIKYKFNENRDDKSDELDKKDQLANSLLRRYLSILTDPTSAHIAHRSIDNDTTLVKNVVKELEEDVEESNSQYEVYDFYTLSSHTRAKNDFLTGKTGIAPFALNNNSQILTTLYNVEFEDNNVMSQLEHGSLHRKTDDDQQSIMSWISAMINAHVDIAKDPYISKLNVNKMTYNLVNLMIRTGYGKRTLYFTTQPVMWKMADKYNQSQTEFMKDPSKSMWQIRKDAKYDAACELCGKLNVDEAIKEYVDKNNCFKKEHIELIRAILDNKDGCMSNYSKGRTGQSVHIETSTNDYTFSFEEFEAIIYVIDSVLESPAQALSDLVKYTKIDTKKQGKNISEQIEYAKGVAQTFNDYDLLKQIFGYSEDEIVVTQQNLSQFKSEGLNDLYEKSFIKHKTHKAISLYSRVLGSLLIEAAPQFLRIVSTIADALGKTDSKSIKKISNAVQTKLKTDNMVEYCRNNGIIIPWLVSGNNTIYDRLLKLKYKINNSVSEEQAISENRDRVTSDFINNTMLEFDEERSSLYHLRDKDGSPKNALLKLLIADEAIYYNPNKNTDQLPDKFHNLKFVRLFSQLDMDASQTNNIMQAWEDLLTDRNEEVRMFARDLCVYAFFTSGESFGKYKLFSFVPNKFREDSGYVENIRLLLRNLQNKDWCKDTFNSEFIDDVVLNNINDYSFVRTIKISDLDPKAGWDSVPMISVNGKAAVNSSSGVKYTPNYPLILSTKDFVDINDCPLYIKIPRTNSRVEEDGFNRKYTVFKRVGLLFAENSRSKVVPLYIKINYRGYHYKGYDYFEYGNSRIIDEEFFFSMHREYSDNEFFDAPKLNEWINTLGFVPEEYKAFSEQSEEWIGFKTYSPKPIFGKVKYYGPTMGKTTAAKQNPNLVDFDDIAREPIKQLAEKLGKTVREVKTESGDEYKRLLLDLINEWQSDQNNSNKTLLVSNFVLSQDYDIFSNIPAMPSREEFIRRQVERSEDTSKTKEELTEEAALYYDDLLSKNPEFVISDKYVSEIENGNISLDATPDTSTLPSQQSDTESVVQQNSDLNDLKENDNVENFNNAEQSEEILNSEKTILSNEELKYWNKNGVSGFPRILTASEHTDPAFHVKEIIDVLDGKKGIDRKKYTVITKEEYNNLSGDSKYAKILPGRQPIYYKIETTKLTGNDFNGLYLITKHDGIPMLKLLLTKIPKLIHFSITSLGGTKYEPGVMKYQDMLDRILDYIKQGLDPECITIRIDPIVPGITKFEDIEEIVRRSSSMGIKRVKFSIMDAYAETRKNMSVPEINYNFDMYYGTGFNAKPEYLNQIVDFMLSLKGKYDISLSTCAESLIKPGINKEGCLSVGAVNNMLGTNVPEKYENNNKQREKCTCFGGKIDALAYAKTCLSHCIYCYARHGNEKALEYYNEDGTLKDNQFTKTRLSESNITKPAPVAPLQKQGIELQAGNTYTVDQIAEYYKQTEHSKKFGKLADVLFATAKKLGISYKITNDLDGHSGVSHRYNNIIEINLSTMLPNTILHETIHLAVNYWIDEDNVPKDISDAIAVLKLSFEYIREQYLIDTIPGYSNMSNKKKKQVLEKNIAMWNMIGGREYGFTSFEEFLAELSNESMRAYILQIDKNTDKQKSVLSKIADAVMRLINKILGYKTVEQNVYWSLNTLLTTVDPLIHKDVLQHYQKVKLFWDFINNSKGKYAKVYINPKFKNVLASRLENEDLSEHDLLTDKVDGVSMSEVDQNRITPGQLLWLHCDDIECVGVVTGTIFNNTDGTISFKYRLMQIQDLVENMHLEGENIKVDDYQPAIKNEFVDNIKVINDYIYDKHYWTVKKDGQNRITALLWNYGHEYYNPSFVTTNDLKKVINSIASIMKELGMKLSDYVYHVTEDRIFLSYKPAVYDRTEWYNDPYAGVDTHNTSDEMSEDDYKFYIKKYCEE